MKLSPSSTVIAVSGVLGLVAVAGIGMSTRADFNQVQRGPAVELIGAPATAKATTDESSGSDIVKGSTAEGVSVGQRVPVPTPIRIVTGESPPTADTP